MIVGIVAVPRCSRQNGKKASVAMVYFFPRALLHSCIMSERGVHGVTRRGSMQEEE
jgi:hypothetical protein